MRRTVSNSDVGRLLSDEQPEKHSDKVMVEVLVPIAEKRSAGRLSNEAQPANVRSKVVMAGIFANSPSGILFNALHPSKSERTPFTAVHPSNRSAGMVSSPVQSTNVPVNCVAFTFALKSPEGSDVSDVQPRNVLVNLIFDSASGTNRSSGIDSNFGQL